ncbi:hypothetical protein B0H21DRAFT_161072 [Amylocystis lapponica]|nr:hypothetical protein B0H21DRAFT_161072 [Amylocystis lapponica]
MSAPVDIPRTSSAAASSSGSPSSGLYVPIHKRNAPVSPESPPRSPRRGVSPAARAPRSLAASAIAHRASSPTPIPTQSKIPTIYSIPTLLALSASPSARITLEQQAHIERHFSSIALRTARAPAAEKAPADRRRRAGRKASGAKKLAPSVGEDVESRRRRHGAWGWHAQLPAQADTLQSADGWRHAPVQAVSA